jgi:hypothetical protein
MKAMKSMNMNRMLGSLKRKRTHPIRRAPDERDATLILSVANSTGDDASANSNLDTPEANAARNVVCWLTLTLGSDVHLKHG